MDEIKTAQRELKQFVTRFSEIKAVIRDEGFKQDRDFAAAVAQDMVNSVDHMLVLARNGLWYRCLADSIFARSVDWIKNKCPAQHKELMRKMKELEEMYEEVQKWKR